MTIQLDHLPLPAPKLSTYSSPYGLRTHPIKGDRRLHTGIDIPVVTGTPIYAVADGIATLKFQPNGYGLYIKIVHNFFNPLRTDFISIYAHLSSVTFLVNGKPVEVDQRGSVTAGMRIGFSGGMQGDPNSGGSTAPHFHFELRDENNNPVPEVLEILNAKLQREANRTLLPSIKSYSANSIVQQLSPNRAISPYIASLDSFHPSIQYELTKRSYATETIHSHMPFVKLTSLSTVLSDNLEDAPEGAYCPSLGPHGEERIDFEDMYTTQSGRSAIGYATTKLGETYITTKVIVENSAEETDAPNIPLPGIVSMTTERSTAGPMGVRGGLFKANIKIMVHSVGQLNAMLRYFLRPATRVILEFGRRSSNPEEQITPFNWKRSLDDIKAELTDLVVANKSQKQFIEQYVYGNNGNYDIFIGYVVNFKLNYTGKNTYEIDLTIHSIQQFEVPVNLTGAQSLCKDSPAYVDGCKVVDISGYFNTGAGEKSNAFETLLEKIQNTGTTDPTLVKYKPHVIPLINQNSETSRSYLVSWKFFTDIIMNDITYGLPSIFQVLDIDAATKTLLESSMLAPFDPYFLVPNQDRLESSQVSWHESLRSTNPEVMIIYNRKENEDAERAKIIEQIRTLATPSGSLRTNMNNTTVEDSIRRNTDVGAFAQLNANSQPSGISSLYTGVWLNTNAIKNAFNGVDTLSMGLTKLLVDMNTATEGFWNLQLLSDDTFAPGVHVVDFGLSKQIDKGVREDTSNKTELKLSDFQFATDNKNKDTPKYLYEFNRKTKRFETDDVGSELLDMKLEASLPQVIAVQAIAGVGGVAQQGTWEAIRIDELKKITMFPQVYPNCASSAEAAAAGGDVCKEDTAIATELEELKKSQKLYQSVIRIQALEAELETKRVPALATLVKNSINSFGTALWFIASDKTELMKKLTTAKESTTLHPFNSSNLTKTTVDLTLPGIGGIQLFQSFTVARVPNILKSGYYVVTKIGHEFTTDRGWITKLQGRFRYKPQRVINSRTGNQDTPAPAAVAGTGGGEIPREERSATPPTNTAGNPII